MANKINSPDAVPEVQPSERPLEMLPIEEHRAKLGIGRPVFAGVCAANGWRAGRTMTEAEFCSAVKAFTGAPMSKAVK